MLAQLGRGTQLWPQGNIPAGQSGTTLIKLYFPAKQDWHAPDALGLIFPAAHAKQPAAVLLLY